MTSAPTKIYQVKAEDLLYLLPYKEVNNLSALSLEKQFILLDSLNKTIRKERKSLAYSLNAIWKSVDIKTSLECSTMFEIWGKMHDSHLNFLYDKENKKYLSFLKQQDCENLVKKLISFKRGLFFEHFICKGLKALLDDLKTVAKIQHPVESKELALEKLSDLPGFVKCLELGKHFKEGERLAMDSYHKDKRPFNWCFNLMCEKLEKMLLMQDHVFEMVSELKPDGAQKKLLADFVKCKVAVVKLLENSDNSDPKGTFKLYKNLYNKLFYFYEALAQFATTTN